MKTKLAIFMTLISLFSCDIKKAEHLGNGERETRDFEIKEFSSVKTGGNFKIILQKSTEPGIRIETDRNLFPYLKVENEGDLLSVYSEESIDAEDGTTIYLSYTSLENFSVSGATSIEANEKLEGDDLVINLSGAGEVDLEIEVEELSVNISGAGSIKLKGITEYQEISMSGAGSYNAFDLISQICKIDVSGVGGANVNVEKDLKANISGIGNVSYMGKPENVQSDVSGLGDISSRE